MDTSGSPSANFADDVFMDIDRMNNGQWLNMRSQTVEWFRERITNIFSIER